MKSLNNRRVQLRARTCRRAKILEHALWFNRLDIAVTLALGGAGDDNSGIQSNNW